ncbi:sodium:alanine symporter family protein [Candidatus Venteria ishoeyi]|uniref:alanine/glycine:cation symporter family protein n=1 Tax=Candidatus Venteria ishoeyi TaxID=1899563 RepID=UPI0025A5B21A|nr:sodium:alanine symporter family protein [Candidatus Venteria ishoeyi]MDM8546667.1 sodium:alanine symporter family protein [Candidatus Venteria ishoeyi]
MVDNILNPLNALVWGPWMLGLILGTGLYLMLGLGLLPLRKLGTGFKMLWTGRSAQGEGDISPFNALMTSLSATIGTGNIAGVATAIAIGGPGALFWMWCTALVGMATKYAEAVCAVHFREVDENGQYVGGPMYYIKNGLAQHWHWLATAFALFGMIAGFGIGNAVQANSVADVLFDAFKLPVWVTGAVLAVLTGLVLLGGIQRIARVAGKLVPLMAVLYVGGGLIILLMHWTEIPAAVTFIVTEAFTPTAATGGFAGASVWLAIQYGVARGVFSNEAGLGSAPIAHAAAATKGPVSQGLIAMLGTFIDTLIVCSITGLVIVISGAWESGATGAALSSAAFEQSLPGVGTYLVSFGLTVFAFTTLLGWSVYSEKCTEYLFGVRAIFAFRVAWILMILVGAMAHSHLAVVWLISDTLNALMALPNLIALLLLSPLIFKLSRNYFTDVTQ